MRLLRSVAIVLLASVPLRAESRESAQDDIQQRLISELQNELASAEDIASSSRRRRTLKNITRDSLSLISKYPQAPNRFAVLGLILECQKELLMQRNDLRNREALLGTCRKLAAAPDDYALMRFEAEALLLQWSLEEDDATAHERSLGIALLADKYCDSPAEAESLMTASLIAFEIGNRDLLAAFRAALHNRFRKDPKVIAFLRERWGVSARESLFRGTFSRADGVSLHFPIDRIGHMYLVCFWSEEMRDLKLKAAEVTAAQSKYPGQFQVFSFNLDELPDGGKKHLRRMGLDWIPMRLPGGRNNAAFLAYGAAGTYFATVVDAQGFIRWDSIQNRKALPERIAVGIEDGSYLPRSQSVTIGDFLIIDPRGGLDPASPPEMKTFSKESGKLVGATLSRSGKSVPDDVLRAIQACFAAPPRRYGQTREESLKSYKKAESLCRDALKQYADAPDIWIVRNRRIIALLGMWNLTGEPKHFENAAREARAALAARLPRGASVVPRFCLAREAIRTAKPDPKTVIRSFMDFAGGAEASGSARAAALILSLDAGDRDLFVKYHTLLRDELVKNPAIKTVADFVGAGLQTWRDAFRKLDSYVKGHEGWGKGHRCCCASLVATVRLRAEMLEHLGKHKAAKADRERAKAMLCPPGSNMRIRLRAVSPQKIKELRDKKDWAAAFAYVDDAIRNNLDNLDRRRHGFASLLRRRAKLFRLLGKAKQADADEERALALTRAYVLKSKGPNEEAEPVRYIDIVLPLFNGDDAE